MDVVVIGAGPAGVVAAIRAAELGARTTLVSSGEFGGMAAVEGPLALSLERDLLVALECSGCGTARRMMRPLADVGARQAVCPACGEQTRPVIEHKVAEEGPRYRGADAIRREIAGLRDEMRAAAARLEFEKAAELRDRALRLEKEELGVGG